MFQNLILGWLARRTLELGGIFGTLWVFYQSLPPSSQNAIERIFTGNWQEIPLGAIVPILIGLWGYIWSFRSTVKPQVVVDGKQVSMKDLPAGRQTIVEETARTAVSKHRTLWERLTQR